VFVSEPQLATLHDASEIRVRLGPEFLAARAIALVPFAESGASRRAGSFVNVPQQRVPLPRGLEEPVDKALEPKDTWVDSWWHPVVVGRRSVVFLQDSATLVLGAHDMRCLWC
jgi:hypothetical protein